MSRLTRARTAVRPALKGRILLAGPPGAGKTRTGLIVAETLADGGPVLVIDTEKESALTYADDFGFDHLGWQPPYDPRELAATITDAGAKYAVVIVDSASHFWRKAGGTLDIAEGKFTGWKAARPAQEDLIDAVLDCRAHVILCARSKVEHVQEEVNGRHVVRKLGMAVQQDDTLEYEMNVAAELDMEHRLTISKSRCITVPVGRFWQPGHAEDMARIYADWLKGGEPPAPQKVVDGLVARLNALPEAHRAPAKQEFMASFGRPDHLRESQQAEAEQLVARWEHEPEPPEGPGDGQGAGVSVDREAAAGGDTGAPTPAPEPGGGGGEAPAPAATRGLNARDVATQASRVLRPVFDAAPARKGTRAVERVRHALVLMCSGGTTNSLNDLSGPGLASVAARLDDIAKGRITLEVRYDDDGDVTFVSPSGKRKTVTWAEAEMAAGDQGAAA